MKTFRSILEDESFEAKKEVSLKDKLKDALDKLSFAKENKEKERIESLEREVQEIKNKLLK